jgi:hypothetical protein
VKTLACERDTAEILERLRTLRPDSPRQWGRMSAHQMVCHLTDSLAVMTGERTARPTSGPAVVLHRTVLKWAALWVPVRWPPGIPTMPEVDQERGGTKPVSFSADVARLESLVELVTTRPFDRSVHPLFGRMSWSAWLRWAYLHMDHHLRQFRA